MSRMIAIVVLALLAAGCSAQSNSGPAYNGYGLSGGPGGIGSAEGPMPYGDIPAMPRLPATDV